jgi:hypothetical protein
MSTVRRPALPSISSAIEGAPCSNGSNTVALPTAFSGMPRRSEVFPLSPLIRFPGCAFPSSLPVTPWDRVLFGTSLGDLNARSGFYFRAAFESFLLFLTWCRILARSVPAFILVTLHVCHFLSGATFILLITRTWFSYSRLFRTGARVG